MNAKEAREKSLKQISNLTSKELDNVYKKIDSAIEKGSFDTFYYGRLCKDSINTLSKCGYNVLDWSNHRDGEPTYKIEW